MIGKNNAEEKGGCCIRGEFIILFCPKMPWQGILWITPGKEERRNPGWKRWKEMGASACLGEDRTFYAPTRTSFDRMG